MRFIVVLLFISYVARGQSNQELRFIENKGQWNSEIDFQALVPGGRVGVSPQGFSVVLLDLDELDGHHMAGHGELNESDGEPNIDGIHGHYFQINLVGANPFAEARVENQLAGYNNYYLGKDSCRWATKARAYSTILYRNVYNGIDFRVSSVGKNLKYDFIVAPGVDPSQIKIEYCGVNGVAIANTGALEIATAVGSLRELAPISYQLGETDEKRYVQSEYRLESNNLSFSFPSDYDDCRALVIDPLLIFSTYSGSTADNWGSTATPGERGTLYSAGVVTGELGGFFPTTIGAFQTDNAGQFDVSIIKYDSAGTKFLYATLLGGSGNDSPESLVVDNVSGDLLVLGVTSSSDYPTSAGSFDQTFNGGVAIYTRVLNSIEEWDILLTRFSSQGDRLIGSTYLGGSGNDGFNPPNQVGGNLVVNYGDEMRGDVISDADGNVYISSVSSSSDFPIVKGFDNSFNEGNTDGIVVKMKPDLSAIIWSSYIGGSGVDAAYTIKFDTDKNIVLGGGTASVNFPVTAGAYQTNFSGVADGWIACVAADGSAITSATFTGTAAFDQVYFIDLNASGNVYCYGQTAGRMPITAGVYRNVNSGQFLQEFSSDLKTLKLSTVFGSGANNGRVIPNISPTAFLVNDCGNIYMAGWGGATNANAPSFWQSSTENMPITNDAFQKTTSGSDFYFIVLNSNATQLVYSTYLGGGSSKTHVDGGTSRFDKFGIVYHAVCAGCGGFSDFPTTPNAKSRLNASPNCNNAAFKFDLSTLRAKFTTNNVALTKPGFNNVCFPEAIVFENTSIGGRTIAWDFGDGRVENQTATDSRTLTHRYKRAGEYKVKLTITDISTCSVTDTYEQVIKYFEQNIKVGPDAEVCEGKSFRLTASGGATYRWTNSDGTFNSADASPEIRPQNDALYFVSVVDANGCSRKDTVAISINRDVKARFQTSDEDFKRSGITSVCFPEGMGFMNVSIRGETFVWNFDDGTVLSKSKTDNLSTIHKFQRQGVYRVKLVAANPSTCNKKDSVVMVINAFRNTLMAEDDLDICEGASHQLKTLGGNEFAWSTADGSFTSTSPSPIVQPRTTTAYFVTINDANGCIKKDTVNVGVLAKATLDWQYELKGNCVDRPSVFVQNLSPAAKDVDYRFEFGDGFVSRNREVEHNYTSDNLFVIKFIADKKSCTFQDEVRLPIFALFVPNVFTPDASPGFNDTFKVGFGPSVLDPWMYGLPLSLSVVDRWGNNVFESSDYKNDWDAHNIPGGVYYFNLKVGNLTVCKSSLHIIK